MIYIDPPYGIRFGSNWQVSTRRRDVRDGRVEDVAREPEVIRAFRDTWEMGIHSYLTYLRDRFIAARELLAETGSIFIQIGDENLHLVRSVLDEIFGSGNFCSVITVKKTGGLGTDLLKNVNDFVLWFAKDRDNVKYRQLFSAKEQGVGESTGARYDQVEGPDGSRRALTRKEKDDPGLIPSGWRTYQLDNLVSSGTTPSCVFPFEYSGVVYNPGGQRSWKTNLEGMKRLADANRLSGTGATLRYVRYLDDFAAYELNNIWDDVAVGTAKLYVVQTASKVPERAVLMTTDPGDLVLDPTCGSGTTAHVAEQWGRRWITIDTSRVSLALARTRLMGARYPYYLLADTPDGAKREAEILGQAPPAQLPTGGDVRRGFVYRRVPHVTLRSIANNPDVRDGMTQEEIDAAIARHAETELLYDQPYEDRSRVRVAGPFTVESLSPHRLPQWQESNRPASERDAQELSASADFSHIVIENLRKAGVQNTRREERLKFDRLESYANPWLHAEGEFTEKEGTVRRIAVSIGPEFGAVTPEQIKEAAKEALKGRGFDLLVVAGLAFDAHASETAKEFAPEAKGPGSDFAIAEEQRQYGKLPVLLARINPDLTMGLASEQLLKKTGAGNLFMVFGEPDIAIESQPDGKLVVEIKGLDVYDPTTGQVRTSSTDDIACWFIDTAYNDESFFVRHAYFTGANEPYDSLKRALRAEIDEARWSQLYSTRSFPFDTPATGKIAVKVINHYGDEVLKVYGVK
jgi:adenine-specific DNA-methyltransferase